MRLEEKKQNIVFQGQWENEEVKMIVRKHWMAYIPTIGLMLAMFLFLFFFFFVFKYFFEASKEVMDIYYLISGIICLCILTFGLTSWIDFYFDIVIVTDQRLISIQQKALFARGVDALGLMRVQNISAEARGFFQTVFNYGTAYVETAGEQGREEVRERVGVFMFDFIPNPYEFSENVMRYHDQLVANVTHGHHTAVGEGELKRAENSKSRVYDDSFVNLSKAELDLIGGAKKQKNDNYPNEPDV